VEAASIALRQVTYETPWRGLYRNSPFTATRRLRIDYGEGIRYDIKNPARRPRARSCSTPPWLYARWAILCVILAIAMSARRRRRRMFEDDEMD
jgi:hypothetical protein